MPVAAAAAACRGGGGRLMEEEERPKRKREREGVSTTSGKGGGACAKCVFLLSWPLMRERERELAFTHASSPVPIPTSLLPGVVARRRRRLWERVASHYNSSPPSSPFDSSGNLAWPPRFPGCDGGSKHVALIDSKHLCWTKSGFFLPQQRITSSCKGAKRGKKSPPLSLLEVP